MTDFLVDTIIMTFVALGVLFALSVVYRPKNLWVALVTILLTVTLPVALYSPLTNALGYSVATTKDQTDKFLSYTVGSKQVWIYVWVMEFDTDEPRSYKIPYSKEKEEKLAEAAQKAEEGIPQGVKLPQGEEDDKPQGADTMSPTELQVSDLEAPGGYSK